LSLNSIGDEGARGIASGNLSSLTDLDLIGNRIGDEGKKAITKNFMSPLFRCNY